LFVDLNVVLTTYSKENFDQAVQESGKFVLILAYKDSVHPKAEEFVDTTI